MDLIDKIRAISTQAQKQLDLIQTEEATKTALVMPFIVALGYNVFDPSEVSPELTADVGTKKGEKVDYAILKDGKPVILFECKWCKSNLDGDAHLSQLYRYFTVTEAKFAVLTNGIIYRFYTDSEDTNKMDSKPFFEFSLFDFHEQSIEELKRFSKSTFEIDKAFTSAIEMKYTKEIKKIMADQINSPSDDFTRFFISQVYSGRITQIVLQQFTQIVKRAISGYINDRINEKFKSVLEETPSRSKPESSESTDSSDSENKDDRIITTEEELQGYYIVKAILSEIIDSKRITMRDTVSYCGILLDDNNRKPICRFHFNSRNKSIGLFDNNRNEERIKINSSEDIYKYTERIKAVIAFYDKPE